MLLSTFGAVMAFSIEMIQGAVNTYEGAVQHAQDRGVREALETLLGETKKDLVLMEQIRRENITEMILEPIDGLHGADYEMDSVQPNQLQDTSLIRMAWNIEDRMKRFFSDASRKVSIPEVERRFRKIVQKKERNLIKLECLITDKELTN